MQGQPEGGSYADFERCLDEFVRSIRQDVSTAEDFTLSKVQWVSFTADGQIGLPDRE